MDLLLPLLFDGKKVSESPRVLDPSDGTGVRENNWFETKWSRRRGTTRRRQTGVTYKFGYKCQIYKVYLT